MQIQPERRPAPSVHRQTGETGLESEICPVSSMAMPRLENPGVSCLRACPQFYYLARLFLHLTQSIPPEPKGTENNFLLF